MMTSLDQREPTDGGFELQIESSAEIPVVGLKSLGNPDLSIVDVAVVSDCWNDVYQNFIYRSNADRSLFFDRSGI